MKIQVGGLSEGIHEYDFLVCPADLAIGEEFRSDIQVHAALDKSGRQMFLEARISASGVFVCDRCLADFTLPLKPSYRMYYVSEEEDMARIDPSEVQVVQPNLNVIDLSEDVRQTLMVSVPLKLLCRTDCRGLCPRCGKNLNVDSCSCAAEVNDSRWDALQSLKDKFS
jgi:uncharacterized protein